MEWAYGFGHFFSQGQNNILVLGSGVEWAYGFGEFFNHVIWR